MAHSKSRLKQIKTDKVRTLRNKAKKSALKTAEKAFRANIEAADKDASAASLKAVCSKLDKLAKTNTIHAGKASRKKSRLTLLFNKTFA